MSRCFDRPQGMLSGCPYHDADGGFCDDPSRKGVPQDTPCEYIQHPQPSLPPLGRIHRDYHALTARGLDPWTIKAFRQLVHCYCDLLSPACDMDSLSDAELNAHLRPIVESLVTPLKGKKDE